MVLGGGSQLKAMVPKGWAVAITIQNPDGHQSASFSFTRWRNGGQAGIVRECSSRRAAAAR